MAILFFETIELVLGVGLDAQDGFEMLDGSGMRPGIPDNAVPRLTWASEELDRFSPGLQNGRLRPARSQRDAEIIMRADIIRLQAQRSLICRDHFRHVFGELQRKRWPDRYA